MSVRNDLAPLFEQYGVDIVFSGHEGAALVQRVTERCPAQEPASAARCTRAHKSHRMRVRPMLASALELVVPAA
jgi:hypothetical protein